MYKLRRIQSMFCQEHIINTVLYFCNIVCNAKIIAEIFLLLTLTTSFLNLDYLDNLVFLHNL